VSAKVQVIFYSMYGHVFKMAKPVMEVAKSAGADVSLSDDVPEKYGAKAAPASLRAYRWSK
jgi:NAD(P)H dehydrogenase (quinone)